MTVAQRKEANELRKVRALSVYFFLFPHDIMFFFIALMLFVPLLLQTLKPLMEKRRRARINESLNRLKELIVPLVANDVSI